MNKMKNTIKISKLIKELQSQLDRMGDLDVKISLYNYELADYTELYDIVDVNYGAHYNSVDSKEPQSEWVFLQANYDVNEG